ncbi:universal stress protein [Echinococcus granulosus]|uniref:Universal stress protein n=1 Tax=Echinococcus granulosus TaxID=6210 RepID=W6UCF7_ECHGR|nr:universal stress protein [Echinococcus granulosus]EUB58406.1 universal stress protein [Echinococcus granulosus]
MVSCEMAKQSLKNLFRAFSWYLEHLKTGTYRVSFIHGIEPAHSSPTVALAIESPPIMVDDMISVMEESIILGRKLGQEYMKPAKVAKLSYKAFLHIDTKPGSAIVRSAAKHKAQLIVHGSRGFGVIKRALLDNISDYVVHNSTVPVAVVPPKPAQSRNKDAKCCTGGCGMRTRPRRSSRDAPSVRVDFPVTEAYTSLLNYTR